MNQEQTLELQPMSNQTIPFLDDQSESVKPDQISFFSKLFFLHVYPTMKISQKVPLETKMIKELPQDQESQTLHIQFKKYLIQDNADDEVNVQMALLKTFLKPLIIVFFILLLYTFGQLAIPILIKFIIDYIMLSEKNTSDGVKLILIILLVRISNVFTNSHSRAMIRNLGYDSMAVVSMEIMTKSLNISFQSNKSHTNGQVLNLMQVDAAKLQLVTTYISGVALIPLQLGVSLYIMYKFIGISFLAGLIIILSVMFFNIFIGKLIVAKQNILMKDKDARTKCGNEIFSSIKFIKINALEKYFQNKLNTLRIQEISSLKKRLNLSALNIFTVWLTPQLILSCTFGLYVLLGHDLSPSNTFAIISLFQILQQPLLQLPIAFNSLIETNISLKRIQRFLMTKELQTGCIKTSDFTDPTAAIKIQNGTFYWPSKQNQEDPKNQIQGFVGDILNPSLQSIALTIQPGKFISIVGDVGSGKSSLLQCLLSEMIYFEGYGQPNIRVNGKIAYVSQKPWIQNATVKDNILFGKEYDENRYEEAIHYSCLKDDIQILINGDQTMIGEKGINLSGGQKARVSLARAIYSNSDIYLFDDPLSAVDVHVGKFLMNECFLGYLQNTTRILVTHALNFCKYTDFIYLFENGKIHESGSYIEIQKSQKFKEIYSKFHTQEHHFDEQSPKKQTISRISSQSSTIQSSRSIVISPNNNNNNNNNKDDIDDLMILEDRATGAITMDIFSQYFKFNGGISSFVIVALIMVIWIFCYLGSGLWIADWTVESDDENSHFSNETYFIVYFFLGLGQGLFAFIRAWIIIHQSIRSASTIHNRMIQCLLYAPQCQFFERVPQGRIMNRLTKDLNTLDSEIYWNISWLYTKFSQLISNAFLNVYASTYYIFFPILVFFYICFKIERMYMKASRELHRLELISKSPILSYFTETLSGLPIIRAFSQQNQFLTNFSHRLDTNRKIFYESVCANAWFIQMLGFTSFIVNMSAIVYCVFYNTNAAFAGLLMTYASNIDLNISQTVESIGLLENGIISFERCVAYTKIKPEQAYEELVEKALNNEAHQEKYIPDWPKKGEIEFKNYTVMYRANLAPALKDLSFSIAPRQKVGIVGRTGAGKSTITLSLLRILEASQGQILIDGVDIASLSLQQLRDSITIILQDATIFDGTLRENLDPQNTCSDSEITKVIEQCCLKRILKNRDGLNTAISEGGENLSAGEKQLLCIARAVLKKKPIVLIDEATANIDIETENQIQQTIQNSFKDCTVLTIAHRINTILHCDKIIVIDKGVAIEEGNTSDLLDDQDSLFYKIYKEALQEQRGKQQ